MKLKDIVIIDNRFDLIHETAVFNIGTDKKGTIVKMFTHCPICKSKLLITADNIYVCGKCDKKYRLDKFSGISIEEV